jgi:hypothetical protein
MSATVETNLAKCISQVAAAYIALLFMVSGSAAFFDRPFEKDESIVWEAACETFETPSGLISCNNANKSFFIRFVYSDGTAVLGWGGLTIVAAAAVAKDAPAHGPPAFETGYKTDDGRIQGRWKGTCEIFQTPTGPIPCASMDPEFIVGSYGDDGMSFNFWSAEGYPDRSIYLSGDSWTDYHLSRLPRGVSRVLVVNDRISRESPAWAKGFCSISRDGHDFRCKADLDSTNGLGGHYEVVFRNITPSPVNAGKILQRLAGVKVQQGRKQEGPNIGGLLACRVSFLRGSVQRRF